MVQTLGSRGLCSRRAGAQPRADRRPRIGTGVVHHEDSPTLLIAGRSFEEFLASRSKNFREQVRRRDRKLRREHEIELRLSGADRLEADLDTLFRLHEARWSEGESSALAGSRE